MSDQTENEMQQTETLTPEEVREALLTELAASKQEIEALSDEQLESIIGAGGCVSCANKTIDAGDTAIAMRNGTEAYYKELRNHGWGRWKSAIEAVKNGPDLGKTLHKTTGHQDVDPMRSVIARYWPSNERPPLFGRGT